MLTVLVSVILFIDTRAQLKVDFIQAPITLHPDDQVRNINDSIRVFYTLDTLSGYQALEAIYEGKLKENKNKRHATSALADMGFWLMFSLKNASSKSESYYLELAFNRTDLIYLYSVSKNNSVHLEYMTGDTFRFSQRPVNYRNFIFPIDFAPNQERVFLINIEKRGSIDRFPLKIYPASSFASKENTETLFYGLFFGAIAIIVIFSIVISIYLKRILFMHYGIYALGVGLFLFTSLGLTFKLITPNWPWLNYYNVGFLSLVVLMLVIRFSQSYFNTFDRYPIIHKIFNFLFIDFGVLMLGLFLFPSFYISQAIFILNILYISILLVFITAFVTAYKFRKVNQTNATLFVLGYLASFLGIAYTVLIDAGLATSYIIADSYLSVLAGFFIEFIFLSSAMVVYVRKEFKQKEFFQAQLENNLSEDAAKIMTTYLEENHGDKDVLLQSLSTREGEILQLVGQGKSSKQIAEDLFLSLHTVHTHRKNIKKKLDVSSNAELVQLAVAYSLARESSDVA